jgi:hypothetical protein
MRTDEIHPIILLALAYCGGGETQADMLLEQVSNELKVVDGGFLE